MDRWREDTVLRLTVVLLVAGLTLVGLGAAGVASSPLLVVALLAAAAGLYALGSRLDDLERPDRRRIYADLPLAPLVGAVVALRWLGATPGELQALGGVVGLVGMANYFLRPLYHLCYRLTRRVASVD